MKTTTKIISNTILLQPRQQTIMNTAIQAAQANCEGINMLRLGNVSEAHQFFQAALSALMPRGSNAYYCDPKSSPSSQRTNTKGHVDGVDSYPRSPTQVLDYIEIESSFLDDDHFYICKKAIAFSADESNSLFNLYLFSAAILFNLALCYQIEGTKRENNAIVQKAVQLYARCVNLLKAYNSSRNESCILLSAALNNQAQLCHRSQNSMKAQELLKELSDILTNHGSHMQYETQEIFDFFLNTFAYCQTCIAAPCA